MDSSASERTPLIENDHEPAPGPSRNSFTLMKYDPAHHGRLRELRRGFERDDPWRNPQNFYDWVEAENKAYYQQLREQRAGQHREAGASNQERSEWTDKCCKFIFNRYSLMTFTITLCILIPGSYFTWDTFIEHAMKRGQKDFTRAASETVFTLVVIFFVAWAYVCALLKILRSSRFVIKGYFDSRRSGVASVDPEAQ